MKRSEPLWKRLLAKRLLQEEKDAVWEKLSAPALIWPGRSQGRWGDNDVASMYPHQNFIGGMKKAELKSFATSIGVPKSMIGEYDEKK